MTGTRYDICYTPTKLAELCNDPGEDCYKALVLWVNATASELITSIMIQPQFHLATMLVLM